jgi:hypothetical protein
MERIASIETLKKVYRSNADLMLHEFREIVEAAGYRLTGGWDDDLGCPEIVPADGVDRRAAA